MTPDLKRAQLPHPALLKHAGVRRGTHGSVCLVARQACLEAHCSPRMAEQELPQECCILLATCAQGA